MDVRDYVHILRTRWRALVACVLLALFGAALLTISTPRTYQATAQLFVSTSQSSSADSGSGLNQGALFAQQRVKSYAEIISSPEVTGPVVRTLGLSSTPEQLGRDVSATAPLNTVLINVSARAMTPISAQRVANAVAQQFTVVVAELETPTGSALPTVKVSVIRQADVPTAPISPRTKFNLALGLLLGMATGLAVALLRDNLDTSLKNSSQVQDLLKTSTLGSICFDPSATDRPLLMSADAHSMRAESFRQLRTNLQFVDVDAPPRSIVITSALPKDGKSTTACNLAVTLAQAGVRVALVEADLRRPRLADYMGIEGAVGLTDVLVGHARLDDVLQPWGPDDLLVLPSGSTPPNPSELLGSRNMRDLIEALEQRVDLVLIDATPLLPVTDAAILAAQVSGVIVVLRANKTTREQASRAFELLHRVDARIYGVVLNMTPAKGPGASGYGYGYGAEVTGGRPASAAASGHESARALVPTRGE